MPRSQESGDEKWPVDNRTGFAPFLLQVGEPRGLCRAEGGGVFSREYSGGTARLDCAAWRGELSFPALPH